MSIALLGLALAILAWPIDGQARRIVVLVADGRLADGRSAGWRLAGPRPALLQARRFGRLRALSPARSGLLASVAAVLTAASCARLDGPAVAIACGSAAGIVAATGLSLMGGRLRSRAAAARQGEVVLAVSLLCGELEAGSTPSSALAAAGPIGRDLLRLTAIEPVASGSAVESGDELNPVACAWRMSQATGVPLAHVLGRVRDDLAGRAATRRAVAAAVAGPRASAVLLALLPLLGIGMGAGMGAHPLSVLFGSRGGLLLLCAGGTLDALGLLWTDRLIARAQRP